MAFVPSIASVAPDNGIGSSFAGAFIRDLKNVSPGNLRALWLSYLTDTTTNTLSPDGRTWTNSATIQGRITPQGNGILVSFNGTDQYVTTPDTANLTFGNGTTDSAFSIVALANITDTSGVRSLVTKWDTGATTREYIMRVSGTDTLVMFLGDESAAATPSRSSDSALSQGVPVLVGGTYSAATGGATAANDITLYQNGAVIASTASNAAGYVAMENTNARVVIGAQDASGTPGSFMSGSIGFAAIYAAALSAIQHARIAQIARGYYKVAL